MCLITGLATALGVSTAVAWGIVASAAVTTIATATSTTLGVTSSIQSAKAEKAQYEYSAKVNEQNAKIAQNNADQKRQEGIEEARKERIRTLQAIGSQQAAIAANGFDVSNGSALDVIDDTAATGELNALTTKYNYETQALGFEQQANNYNNQANLDRISGANAYKAGMTNALAAGVQGLGNAAGVATKWYSGNYKKVDDVFKSVKSKVKYRGVKMSGGVVGDNVAFM